MRSRISNGIQLLIVLALALLWLPPTTARAAGGEVTFINTGNTKIYLAKATYVPDSPARPNSSSGSDSRIAVMLPEQPEGYRYDGWWVILPGHSVSFTSEHAYYLEESGNGLRWDNTAERGGLVTSAKFGEFMRMNNAQADIRNLQARGFRSVVFQTFTPGRYTTGGRAYRVVKQEFDFNAQSREGKTIVQRFTVPGPVVDISRDGRYVWAENVSWSFDENEVKLSVYVWGEQVRIGGPREPGYYRGKLTVWYTVPN